MHYFGDNLVLIAGRVYSFGGESSLGFLPRRIYALRLRCFRRTSSAMANTFTYAMVKWRKGSMPKASGR